MNKLMDRLLAASSSKTAAVLSESPFFSMKDTCTTEIPIINLAFSGSLDGGMTTGITMLAGESKTFKTLLALYCMKAYLDKYKDAIAILYDSEFGVTPQYLKSYGIDTSRVLHIPIEHIEMLKSDIVKRLEEIKRGDKVFFMIDSLGALASKKETDDALDEKSVADMTRAKAMRSLLRIITPHFTMKDIPCFIINHVYMTMEMYSQVVIPGGTAMTYLPNAIFVISKSQEKVNEKNAEGKVKEVVGGYKFTINIHKSRFVKEKSKFPFTVMFEKGILKWSGLLDLAVDAGYIAKPKVGYFQRIDRETGEFLGEKSFKEKDLIQNDDFWNELIETTDFREYLKKKYTLGETAMLAADEIDEEEVDGDYE